MSGNGPWTGGLANREYRRGTRPEPVVDADAVTTAVQAYLDECRQHRLTPTETAAVKVVPGPKTAVQAAYRALTGGAR